MNQNDYVALGLSALVVGSLAVFGPRLGGQQPAPPNPNPNPSPFPPLPFPPPGVNPLPPPPAPGTDPQYEAARRTIEALTLALQAQGGGTPAQRESAAQALDAQAAAPGQSPAAAALLRHASLQLRSGQLPVVPPSPSPGPAPAPGPFGPFGPIPPIGPVPPFTPGGAARTSGTPTTGEAAPNADLTARYTELRNHLADYLQGARTIDSATLGAADRTSTDLLRAGDAQRASDLGALATASYARAGIARPQPVTA